MTLRCFAAAPTTTPPFGWNDTTDGWILYPASSPSTRTLPVASAYATTVLEVPRSIPTIGSLTPSPEHDRTIVQRNAEKATSIRTTAPRTDRRCDGENLAFSDGLFP